MGLFRGLKIILGIPLLVGGGFIAGHIYGYNQGYEIGHSEGRLRARVKPVQVISPLPDWDCDTPALRLWIYENAENVIFDYKWDERIQNLSCNLFCGIPLKEKQ